MSRIFGDVTQIGYIVTDLDEAIEHWTKVLGIGPFYRFQPEFDFYRFQGVDSIPTLDIALANSGGLQIELICQTNDAPSAYRDFIAQHGPGMQHTSIWTDTFEDDVARYDALGMKPTVEASLMGGQVRARFYLDNLTYPGSMMEVAEVSPAMRPLMEAIRQASVGWDGTNPVRDLSDLTG